jgi:hypothetical protein
VVILKEYLDIIGIYRTYLGCAEVTLKEIMRSVFHRLRTLQALLKPGDDAMIELNRLF